MSNITTTNAALTLLANQKNVALQDLIDCIAFIHEGGRTAAAFSAAYCGTNKPATIANRITNMKAAILTAKRTGLTVVANGTAAMLESRAIHESTGGYADPFRQWARGAVAAQMGTKARPQVITAFIQANDDMLRQQHALHLAELAASMNVEVIDEVEAAPAPKKRTRK